MSRSHIQRKSQNSKHTKEKWFTEENNNSEKRTQKREDSANAKTRHRQHKEKDTNRTKEEHLTNCCGYLAGVWWHCVMESSCARLLRDETWFFQLRTVCWMSCGLGSRASCGTLLVQRTLGDSNKCGRWASVVAFSTCPGLSAATLDFC